MPTLRQGIDFRNMKNLPLKSLAVFSFIVGAAFFVGSQALAYDPGIPVAGNCSPSIVLNDYGSTDKYSVYCNFTPYLKFDPDQNATFIYTHDLVDFYNCSTDPGNDPNISGYADCSTDPMPTEGNNGYGEIGGHYDFPVNLLGPVETPDTAYSYNGMAASDFFATLSYESTSTATSTNQFDERTTSLFNTIINATEEILTKALTKYYPYLLVFIFLFSMAAWFYKSVTRSAK